MKVINLPTYSIIVNINDQGGGGISSAELQDEDASPEYKAAVNALLSVILAHACAGVDVEAPAYLEGIEVAVDSIADEFGE